MIPDTGATLMKKTLLAVLTVSLLSAGNSGYGSDEKTDELIKEARNQNISAEDMNTISEIKAESIRMTDLAKQEVTSSSEKKADEQSLLIQTKKTLYELRETMDPETYEKMLTSLTEMEKSAADNTENVSVDDPSHYPIYIFASQSMGDTALKSLYSSVAGESNVFIIFRGILPGESLASFSERQHRLYKPEKDKESEAKTFFPPNIQINPLLFRQYNVTDVPQIIIADPDQQNRNSTCMPYENEADSSEVCYLSRISGISNHIYLRDEAKKDRYGNLAYISQLNLPIFFVLSGYIYI